MMFSSRALLLLVPFWLQIAPSVQQEPVRLEGGCSDYLNELTVIPDVITYRWTVNVDSMDASKSTIKFQYEYAFPGWVGWGIQETAGKMMGGEAVIGIPEDGSVKKYKLGGYTVGEVVPMPDEQQTLMDASIVQSDDGMTVLSFTKYLSEPGELPINTEGVTNAMGAVGSTNTLAAHAPDRRGGVPLSLTPDCIDGVLVEQDATPDMMPAPAPVPAPGPAPAPEYPDPVKLEGTCSDYLNELQVFPGFITYRWTVNADSMDASKSTIRFQYEYAAEGWIGWGVQETAGKMMGGEAVIGIPEDGSVKKYKLGGYTVGEVVPMPDEQQTLMDASIVQNDGMTVLSFTKYLAEEGQIPINTEGLTNGMGAVGATNTLAAHAPDRRGSISLPLTPDCIDGVLVEAPKEPDHDGHDHEHDEPPSTDDPPSGSVVVTSSMFSALVIIAATYYAGLN